MQNTSPACRAPAKNNRRGGEGSGPAEEEAEVERGGYSRQRNESLGPVVYSGNFDVPSAGKRGVEERKRSIIAGLRNEIESRRAVRTFAWTRA